MPDEEEARRQTWVSTDRWGQQQVVHKHKDGMLYKTPPDEASGQERRTRIDTIWWVGKIRGKHRQEWTEITRGNSAGGRQGAVVLWQWLH